MKHSLLLLGLLTGMLALAGCSKSDDSISDGNEHLILGTWKPIKEVDVCARCGERTYLYDNFEQQSRCIFTLSTDSDGSVIGLLEVIENDLLQGKTQASYNSIGTWTLVDEELTITLEGSIVKPTFFELSDESMRIGYFDSKLNTPCDDDNMPSHYYTEFVKLD